MVGQSGPEVSLCLATSLDGRISTKPGSPPNFTSREDLARLMRLRSEADALLIGAGTVRGEQVLPLVRDEGLADAREAAGKPRHPTAVVVSNSLDLPWDGRYFRYRKQRMILLTSQASAHHRQLAEDRDVEILETGENLALGVGLGMLYDLGLKKILAEGGGGLVHGLLEQDLVDKAYLTLAPVFIGGGTPQLVAGPQLSQLKRFKLADCEIVGDECHLTYTRPAS